MESSSWNEQANSNSSQQLSNSNSAHTSPSHSRAPSSIPMRNINLGLDNNTSNLHINNNNNHNLQPIPSTTPSNNSSSSSLSVPINPLQSNNNHNLNDINRTIPSTDSLSNQPPPPQQDSTNPQPSTSSTPLIPINHFSNPNLRSDLILLISQWLQDEGFGATRLMLLDEANVKNREREELKADHKKLRKALIEGDFVEIDKLLSSKTGLNKLVKHEKSFRYSVYKQQYLELIEQREFQKAFTFLNKKLKPLEHYQPNSTEFQNLCYLLTAKSVTDAPQFRNWDGIGPAREKLIEEYDKLIAMERAEKEGGIPTSGLNESNNRSDSNTSSSMLGGMGGISNDPNETRTSSDDHHRNLNDELSNLNLGNSSQDENGSSSNVDNLGAGGSSNSDSKKLNNNTSKNNLLHHQRELNGGNYVPPHRLITLLSQSLTHQIESARYKAQKTPVIDTLMWDWRAMVVPNFNQKTLRGHRRNVKCVAFVGESGDYLVSGSSDNNLRLWSTTEQNQRKPIHTQVPASSTTPSSSSASSSCISVLTGHASRVWSVDSTKSGQLICSGSGDGTTRIWRTNDLNHSQASILAPNSNSIVNGYGISNNSFVNSNGISGSYLDSIRSGDIYACKFLPNENQVVAGGYDRIIRMYDINTSSCVRTFTGHQSAITGLSTSPSGNLIASSSKDSTIKIWDTISGNHRTLETHLGEITSVSINESGTLLVTNSKDNSCKIIDFRMLKTLKRLTSHLNSNKNFIRSNFLGSKTVVSGSEDGLLYLFDVETGEQIETLKGHGLKNTNKNSSNGIDFENEITNTSANNTVYEGVWNRNRNLLASCGDDGTLRTWTHK